MIKTWIISMIGIIIISLSISLVSGQLPAKCTSVHQYMSTLNNYCTTGVTPQNNPNLCYSSSNCTVLQQLISGAHAKCLTLQPIKTCMESNFTVCTNGLAANITSWFNQNQQEFCDGSSPKQSVLTLLPQMAIALDSSSSCFNGLSEEAQSKLSYDAQSCYYDTVGDFYSDPNPYEGLVLYGKLYARLMRCMYTVYRHHLAEACPSNYWEAMLLYYKLILPAGVTIPLNAADLTKTQTPRTGPRTTLVVWGDPHFRVYKKGMMTCKAEGYKTYLKNDFVQIKATNSLVSANSNATIVTSITIDFLSNGAVAGTYNASSGSAQIEAIFTDGNDTITAGQTSYKMARGVDKPHVVVITADAIGLMIIIRKYESFYPMILVRMADSVLDASFGLFIDGCSTPTDTSSARGKRDTATCRQSCGSMDAAFQDSCYYDCDITGNAGLVAVTSEINGFEKQAEEADSNMSDGGLDGGGLDGGAIQHAPYFTLFLTISLLVTKYL